MPANVSASARKTITAAFGTEIIFSDPMEGSDGAIRLVREIVAENPDKYFYPDQYSNPSNPLAHYHGTGREIWEQTGGRVTHFVAGIGTSGTIMGTRRRLKELHARHRGASPSSRPSAARARGPQAHGQLDRAGRSTTRTSSTACCRWTPTRAGTWPNGCAEHEGLLVGHSSGA